MWKKYSRGTRVPAQFTFLFDLRILCFFFFGIFHHLPSPSQDLLLSSAFYITYVFHFQTFFFFRSGFLLQVFLFFFFWSGSSFFIILLLFSLSFFKDASMEPESLQLKFHVAKFFHANNRICVWEPWFLSPNLRC